MSNEKNKKSNSPLGLHGTLESLIQRYMGSAVTTDIETNLRLANIKEFNPDEVDLFRLFDESLYGPAQLDELNESLVRNGQLFPVYLFKPDSDSHPILFAGVKRYLLAKRHQRALKGSLITGLTLPEIIAYVLQNITNQRDNPLIVAAAYKRLKSDYEVSYAGLAKILQVSKSQIINRVRLLDMPAEIRMALRDGSLTFAEARPLNGLSSDAQKLAIFKKIKEQNCTARQVEELVREIKNPGRTDSVGAVVDGNKIIVRCRTHAEALELIEKIKKLQ